MNPQIREYLSKARLLMVINNCGRCAKWKEFIERENLTVPLEKRIRVINCTSSNSLSVIDYNIINTFDKYMEGNFPFLFLDGKLIQGANSKEECEAYVKAVFHKDLIVPRHNQFMFDKNCKYVKKGFKTRLICE